MDYVQFSSHFHLRKHLTHQCLNSTELFHFGQYFWDDPRLPPTFQYQHFSTLKDVFGFALYGHPNEKLDMTPNLKLSFGLDHMTGWRHSDILFQIPFTWQDAKKGYNFVMTTKKLFMPHPFALTDNWKFENVGRTPASRTTAFKLSCLTIEGVYEITMGTHDWIVLLSWLLKGGEGKYASDERFKKSPGCLFIEGIPEGCFLDEQDITFALIRLLAIHFHHLNCFCTRLTFVKELEHVRMFIFHAVENFVLLEDKNGEQKDRVFLTAALRKECETENNPLMTRLKLSADDVKKFLHLLN